MGVSRTSKDIESEFYSSRYEIFTDRQGHLNSEFVLDLFEKMLARMVELEDFINDKVDKNLGNE